MGQGDVEKQPCRALARRHSVANLEAATTAARLPAGAVRGHGGDILDAAYLNAAARKGTNGSLSPWPWGLGLVAARSAHLNVQGGDADLLELLDDILRGKHRCVGRRLIAVGLHLHASGDAANRLAARQVRDVNERVVERRENMGHAEAELALANLWANLRDFFNLFLHFGLRSPSSMYRTADTLWVRQGGVQNDITICWAEGV